MGRRKQKSSDASDPSSSAPVTESWSQKDERVKVTEGHGLDLSLSARIDGDKDLIFDILTEPDPSHAFRALKKVLYHHVLEDDGKGCKKVAICHRACAKFLFFSMTFDTHLHVVQDAQAGKVRFQAVGKENKSMKMYDGGWEIQPFSDKAMDSARHGRLNPSLAAVSSSTWMRNTSNIFNHFNKKKSESSLVTLEQKIVPRYKLPPGVKGLARRIVAKQVQDMMKDLRAEVERRKKLELGGAESSGKTGSKCGKGAAACAAISLGRGGNLWLHTNPIHADSLIACLPVSWVQL